MRTRSDRIHALIGKLAPLAAAQHAETGTWPNTHPDPGQKRNDDDTPIVNDGEPVPARHSGAPYVIETLPDNRRKVTVTCEDGDVLAGIGPTLDDAIAKLEAKVGLPVGGDEDK